MCSVTGARKASTRCDESSTGPVFVLLRPYIYTLLVALAYYGGTKLGFLFTPPGRAVSTLWPANALLFAALLLTPVRTWPILLSAVLPVHMLVQLRSGIPQLTAAGWYITNISEAVLGAACLRVFSIRHEIVTHKLFESFRGAIYFVLLGVLLAPLLTSFLDAAVVVKTGWGLDLWRLWRDRSLSNMLANLTLIPPVIVIGSKWRLRRAKKHRYVEASLLAAAIVSILAVISGTKITAFSVPLLIYSLLPCLLWAAVRFGSAGAGASLLFITLLSIWNAIYDPMHHQRVNRGELTMASGDFNRDGKLDIVMGARDDNDKTGVCVYLASPDGTYKLPVNYGNGLGLRYVAVADLNGDGKLDIAASDEDNGVVLIFTGDGNGNFSSPVSYSTHGRGPFGPRASRVLSLQIFLIVIGVPLLCLAAAVDERRVAEDRMRRQQQLLTLVSEIGASFVNVDWDRIDDQITRNLVRLREFLGADQASVFVVTINKEFQLAYTASREHIDVGPANRIPTCESDWVQRELRLGHDLCIYSRCQLPGDALERSALAERGIQSMMIAPLGTPYSLAGILSVTSSEEREDWPPDLTTQLSVLGDIFYNAMQRKQAHVALAESEQRFRQTADHSPMLVWMSDTSGLGTFFNQSWLHFTGVGAERQLEDGWTHLVHPEDIGGCFSIYKRAVDARQEFQMEYRLCRHDGEYRWVLDIGVPRFDGEGGFLGFIRSAVDVTERKNAQEGVSGFGGKLLKAQEEERQRIARELHDDIGQRLTLLTIDLGRLQRAQDSSLRERMLHLISEAQSISDSVREISHDLHSAGLDVLPLACALKGLCREFRQRAPVELHFEERNVPVVLPPEIKVCLYRVAQEALQNIAKHSGANWAAVKLTADSNSITLTINDDGAGFVVSQRALTGLGLASMRERLTSIAGTLKVTAAPQQGTRIEACVPLHPATITGVGRCA